MGFFTAIGSFIMTPLYYAISAIMLAFHSFFSLFLDPKGGTVYVANIQDTSLTVLDVRTCNATRSTGCASTRKINVGRAPLEVAIDREHDTVYVTNGDNTVTVANLEG